MQGIHVQDGYSGIAEELLAQMSNEFLIELEENETRLGVHAFEDLPRMAAFTGAELDHDTGLRKVNPSGGLPGEKRRAGHYIANAKRIGEDALKEE
jgi:hypothetical protein